MKKNFTLMVMLFLSLSGLLKANEMIVNDNIIKGDSTRITCDPPYDLMGEFVWNGDYDYGIMLTWPFEFPKGSKERNIDHYNVYKKEDGEEYQLIAEVPESSETPHTYFDKLTQGGEFYYQVTAFYVDGNETCESEPARSYENPEDDFVHIVTPIFNVDENNINNAKIYPNPTSGMLNIETQGINHVSVMTILGQVVYDEAVETDNATIDMKKFGTGIYMVKVVTKEGSVVRKVTVSDNK